MEESQLSKVVIKQLDFLASGTYRCEVSAEGPDFQTVVGQGQMGVIGKLKSN